jgi:hypothetical protein
MHKDLSCFAEISSTISEEEITIHLPSIANEIEGNTALQLNKTAP